MSAKPIPPTTIPPEQDDPGLQPLEDRGKRAIERARQAFESRFGDSRDPVYDCHTCKDTGFEYVENAAIACRSCDRGPKVTKKARELTSEQRREKLRRAIKQERLSTWTADSEKGDE